MSRSRQPNTLKAGNTTTVTDPSCGPFSGVGHTLGDGSPSMEGGGARGDHCKIDWQYYFDTLAPNLSACVDELATHLGLPTNKLVIIKKQYNTEHERCFQTLWEWFQTDEKCKNDTDRLTKLREALEAAGQKLLATKEIPTRSKNKKSVYDGEKEVKEGIEALKVAKRIGGACTRLGRYFKLAEEDIARIVNDNHESVKQGQEIVEACIRRKFPNTRKELCDGIYYVGNSQLIDEMNAHWSRD